MSDGKRVCTAKALMMLMAILAGVLVLSTVSALAATDEVEDQMSGEPLQLETVTVTAEKQEENVQEVPISITVFSDQDIEDSRIQSVEDLADQVPSLMIMDSGISAYNAPSMRGIYVDTTGISSTTGMYVDGVPFIAGFGYESEFVDIERIEVLRGPQGTLYGKNTEAGAINIITRQPDNEFRGRASADGGRLLSMEEGDGLKGDFRFNLSGPIIIDNLYFGASGRYYHRDGFIKNTNTGDTIDERQHWYGKGILRWTPVDALDITFSVSEVKYDDGGPNMTLTEEGFAAFGLPSQEYRTVSCNIDGYDRTSTDTESLKITYDINDALTLTSVSARTAYYDANLGDFDFSSATLMHLCRDAEYTKLSEELRLDYEKDGFKWLVGVYYDNDDNKIWYEIDSAYPTMAEVVDRKLEGDAYAVFANVTYPLTERLSVTAGLRYENQYMEFKDHLDGREFDDSWDALSPRVGVEYHFTPEIMAYASVAKGYRSGGFNYLATDPDYRSYDEEELWSYEIGVKSELWNKRVILNAAAYYMDINDMQVLEMVTPSISYTTNAAEATGKGVEVEVKARLMEGLTVWGGMGYNEVEFEKFKDAVGNYKDHKNPFAPQYTFNLGAQYRHPIGFFARADLIGYGEMYFDKANDYSRDAYQLVNAKIGYEMEDLDIYVYGRNILDEDYSCHGYGTYYTVYSDPGEVGLELVYRF